MDNISSNTPRTRYQWLMAIVTIVGIVSVVGIVFQLGSSFASEAELGTSSAEWATILQVHVPAAGTGASPDRRPSLSMQDVFPDAACASARDQRIREAAEEWAVGAYFNVSGPRPGYVGSLEWRPYIDDPGLHNASAMPYARNVPPGPLARVDMLFYGDSLDHYLINDGCTAFGGQIIDWAGDIIRYKAGSSASAICATKWGTFAFVHLYGSAPTGPYLHGHVNTPDDPYTDTPLRIRRTWEHYESKFGVLPNIVVYQSNLWDVQRDAQTSLQGFELDVAHNRTKKYIHDLSNNIDLLRTLLPQNATLLLRTTPTNRWPGMQAPFTAAIRLLGKRMCVPVLDWDAMIAHLRLLEVGDDMWRDITHLNARHSAAFLKSVIDFVQLHVLMQ